MESLICKSNLYFSFFGRKYFQTTKFHVNEMILIG